MNGYNEQLAASSVNRVGDFTEAEAAAGPGHRIVIGRRISGARLVSCDCGWVDRFRWGRRRQVARALSHLAECRERNARWFLNTPGNLQLLAAKFCPPGMTLVSAEFRAYPPIDS